MIVRRQAPHPEIAGIVSHYQSRDAGPAATPLRIALPARTDVLLEFYFSAPHLLELQATKTRERAPQVATVGPQTFRRVDLLLSGAMDIFTAHFTPTGLYALLGVPMTELADAGVDAAALFGRPAIDALYDRLARASGLAARARIADVFFRAWLAERRRPVSGAVAGAIRHRHRLAEPDAMPPMPFESGLSDRQFRRLFAQQVGVSPARYGRIVRLEAALAARAAAPARSWTDIAHDCGWFDQAHMDKDFVALAGAPPSRFRPAAPSP